MGAIFVCLSHGNFAQVQKVILQQSLQNTGHGDKLKGKDLGRLWKSDEKTNAIYNSGSKKFEIEPTFDLDESGGKRKVKG